MKSFYTIFKKILQKNQYAFIFCLFLVASPEIIAMYQVSENDPNSYNEYEGSVLDSDSKKPLSSASITVDNSNISTITNDEGEFLLKIPKETTYKTITVSYLGYNDKIVDLASFSNEPLKITLDQSITELSEVSIDPKNPEALMKAVLKNRAVNYLDKHTIMTAFYRETIKKRRKYVSLSEAVVDVYKKPYVSDKNDLIKLYKARKSTDYKKLDTLTLKLRGGPSSTLYIDVMKDPESLFTENMFETYDFSFDKSTRINDKLIYVLNFQQKYYIKELLYYGKVFIDAESLAMTKAVFSLNLDDREEASRLFVRKKPARAKVYPTEATYNIDYKRKDGKWHYSYGRIDLTFIIDWKKKLFNSKYKLNVEMAVTDWVENTNQEILKPRDRLKTSVVISDEASGFSDPEFWGEYNVIEPEESIESAIKKIQKQLKKVN